MPRTRYAKSGDIHIAYQVLGEGPIDVVWVQGTFTHLEVMWEDPGFRRFCEEMASFCRLMWFDKRGMGLSERVQAGTLEERMDDARAVMNAVGSERAALMGESEGGPMSILFAATHPARTAALILCGAEVKERATEDWPWGEGTPEEFEESIRTLPDRWGQGRSIEWVAPSKADEKGREWWGRIQMHAATPGGAEAFARMAFDIDVRHVLPAISVPTLVVHRMGDRVCHVENARYLATHIRGARYVELPGEDHVAWSGGDDMLDEIREFLTGVREPSQSDRVLATVLFTDIVGSTELASGLGDRRWGELLERHHQVVRRELARFRGREIDTAGDGFLASFDGPARAIRCARAVVGSVGGLGLQVRAGLHTGECEVLQDKLVGIAVHIGARVAAHAGPGEVLVSSTVRDLVAGSGIEFEDRGVQELKGVPGEWRIYSVTS